MLKRSYALILIGVIFILFSSCKKDEIKYFEIERNELLEEGEWIGCQDSTSGIATKKDMIGFFEHFSLNSDNIHLYTIVDSVKVLNTKKDTLKTFLKWISVVNDTVFYELIKHDSTEIKIRQMDQKIRSYKYFNDKQKEIQDSIVKNRLQFHPSFKDSICDKIREECFKHDFNQYLINNFDQSIIDKLPNETKSIIVEFVLNKDGNISAINTQECNVLIKNELNRVLKLLPEINSASYNNKTVSIKYSFIFNYSKKVTTKSGMTLFNFEHIYLESIDYY